jgi:ATP-grasp domain, R2K clade family 3
MGRRGGRQRREHPVVVLSEAPLPGHGISRSAQELAQITEVARLLGCRIVPLPAEGAERGTAEEALAALIHAPYRPPVPGVWIGSIPTLAHYRAVYRAAGALGVRLLNSPAQHQRALEGDRALVALGDLTPATVVVTAVDQCAAAAEQLGFPLFVKGVVKSHKEAGWDACVATSLPQLQRLVEQTLARPAMTRGRVLVRQVAPLRHVEDAVGDFPISREYRVFLAREQVLASGFYWEEYADTWRLTPADEQAVLGLAQEAARRLRVPFLIVDIAQVESGAWLVVEVGDAQCAGLSQVSPLRLWSGLLRVLGAID